MAGHLTKHLDFVSDYLQNVLETQILCCVALYYVVLCCIALYCSALQCVVVYLYTVTISNGMHHSEDSVSGCPHTTGLYGIL